jgi:hypothetical protein
MNQSEIYVKPFRVDPSHQLSMDMGKVVLEMKCSEGQTQSPHTVNAEYVM